jgi:hypothetical protein
MSRYNRQSCVGSHLVYSGVDSSESQSDVFDPDAARLDNTIGISWSDFALWRGGLRIGAV